MPTEVTVRNFFVFNSTLSTTEEDGANKILFYHPPYEEENKKVLTIGHIEAVISFTRNFNSDEPCESLRTEKTLQVFFNPEPDFWIVITVSAESKSKQTSSESASELEYCNYNLQEPIYLAVMKHWYHTFLMTVGNMTKLMNDNDPDHLRLMLSKFYSKYLQCTDISNCTFMDMFQGISFLPLDNIIHLYAQSFLNVIGNTFQQVHFTMLLYNDSLVWSDLSKRQTQLVYSYILMWVLPEMARDESTVKGNSVKQCLSNQLVGRFITNTWAVKTDSWSNDLGKVPVLRLNEENDETFKSYRLVIYKAHHSILCMFVKMDNPLSADLYNSLDQFLGPKLYLLSEKIKNAVDKISVSKLGSERPAKFVYYNAMNLAIKNSIKPSNSSNAINTTNRPSEFNLSSEALRVLVDISSQHSSVHPTCSIMKKTTNDSWIAGRLCNSREMYIVLNQKLTKLNDVDAEIQNLCDQEFGTILFYD